MLDVKQREGERIKEQAPALKNWGVNRITQVIMFIGSVFTFFTFSEAEVSTAVAGVFAVAGIVATVYEKAKTGVKFGWSAWLANPNTWSNLTAILVGLLPSLSPSAVSYLRTLVEGFSNGNWQQVITAAFSLISIIFFTIRGNKK